jgi:hypothetical protein
LHITSAGRADGLAEGPPARVSVEAEDIEGWLKATSGGAPEGCEHGSAEGAADKVLVRACSIGGWPRATLDRALDELADGSTKGTAEGIPVGAIVDKDIDAWLA